MLCRLCLINLEEANGVSVFVNSDILELIKIIANFLHLDLKVEDTASELICNNCWTHLDGFQRFCKHVEYKQNTLLEQVLEVKSVDDFKDDPESGEVLEAYDLCDELTTVNASASLATVIGLENNEESLLDIEETVEYEALLNGFEEVEFVHGTNSEDDFEVEDDIEVKDYFKIEDDFKVEEDFEMKEDFEDNLEDDVTDEENKSNDNIQTQEAETSAAGQSSAQTIALDIYKYKEPGKYKEELCKSNEFISKNMELKCELCEQILDTFTQLKTHFRVKHKCKGYVSCCGKRITKRMLLVDHLQYHLNPLQFQCLECDKVLSSSKSYIEHMAAVHPTKDELKFQCSFCSQKYSKQYLLNNHLKKHSTESKEHFCKICKKYFRDAYDLKYHEKRVHLSYYSLICEICGKHSQTKRNLDIHIATMHQKQTEPEAQCQICKRWLKDQRSLYKHMYIHRDEASGKKFKCSECGEEKLTRQRLLNHITYNHPRKLLKCPLCEKQLKTTRSLEEHMAAHTGKPLYTCEFCTKTFNSNSNILTHKKKMHPNQWVRKYSQPRQSIDAETATTIDV